MALVISVLISILLAIYCFKLKSKSIEIVNLNEKQQAENNKIAKENIELAVQREKLKNSVQAQQNLLDSISQTRAKLEEDAETLAQKFYNAKVEELMKEADNLKNALAGYY